MTPFFVHTPKPADVLLASGQNTLFPEQLQPMASALKASTSSFALHETCELTPGLYPISQATTCQRIVDSTPVSQ